MNSQQEVEALHKQVEALTAERDLANQLHEEASRQRDNCAAEAAVLREMLEDIDFEHQWKDNLALVDRAKAALSAPSESAKWLDARDRQALLDALNGAPRGLLVTETLANYRAKLTAPLEAEVQRLKDELNCATNALDVTGRDKDTLKRREVELTAEVQRLRNEEIQDSLIADKLRDAVAHATNECDEARAEVQRQRTVIAGLVAAAGRVDVYCSVVANVLPGDVLHDLRAALAAAVPAPTKETPT